MKMELSDYSDSELLALLVAGESIGEPLPGQVAVAQTVIERKRRRRSRYGFTIREIILKPSQYSTFNDDVYWRTKKGYIDDLHCMALMALYEDAYSPVGLLSSPCPTATHFHSKRLPVYPVWSRPAYSLFLMTIGNHMFYREY